MAVGLVAAEFRWVGLKLSALIENFKGVLSLGSDARCWPHVPQIGSLTLGFGSFPQDESATVCWKFWLLFPGLAVSEL